MVQLTKEEIQQLVNDFSLINTEELTLLYRNLRLINQVATETKRGKEELRIALEMMEAVVSSYEAYHDELVKADKFRTDNDILSVFSNFEYAEKVTQKELIMLVKRFSKNHIEKSAVTLRCMKKIRAGVVLVRQMSDEQKKDAHNLAKKLSRCLTKSSKKKMN